MANVATATIRDLFSMCTVTKSSDPSWNVPFSVNAQLIKSNTIPTSLETFKWLSERHSCKKMAMASVLYS